MDTRNNIEKDPVLERLINETAEELGFSKDTIWKVYNHYYRYIYKAMTSVRLINYNKEERRKLAVNVPIPGFGRFVSKFGKAYKIKKQKDGKDKDSTNG